MTVESNNGIVSADLLEMIVPIETTGNRSLARPRTLPNILSLPAGPCSGAPATLTAATARPAAVAWWWVITPGPCVGNAASRKI